MKVDVALLVVFLSLLAANALAQSRNPVSPQVRRAIAEQIVRDGELTAECLREGGGYLKMFEVKPVDLNNDGAPEYIVTQTGHCGLGSEFKWVYRKAAGNYELLLSAGGPRTEITALTSTTNGYRDLQEIAWASISGDVAKTIYGFDGRRYIRDVAADQTWAAFWGKFVAAVKGKNSVALRNLASPESFQAGGGGDSLDEWLAYMVKENLWREFQTSIATGAKACSYILCRQTRNRRGYILTFSYTKGSWRWTGFAGD
jgi:hypothetical protein